jgi:hypothetical protein
MPTSRCTSWPVTSPRANRCPTRDVALVAASLLAGVVAAEYLHVESARSQIAAASESSRGSLSFDLQVGPAVRVGLAAVVCGVAGAIVTLRAKTPDRD